MVEQQKELRENNALEESLNELDASKIDLWKSVKDAQNLNEYGPVDKAYNDGKKAADLLIGYTTDSNWGEFLKLWNQDNTHNEILKFISGYEHRRNFMASHPFCMQVAREYTRNDVKQTILKGTAVYLSKYASKHRKLQEYVSQIHPYTRKNEITKEDSVKLDKIIKSMFKTVGIACYY